MYESRANRKEGLPLLTVSSAAAKDRERAWH